MAARTLIEFGNIEVGQIKRQIEKSIQATMKQAAYRVLRRVIRTTPVDTGRARSNWQLGISELELSDLSPYNPYPKGSKGLGQGVSETTNANAAIAVADARLANYKGGTIYLGNAVTNPVDGDQYIEDSETSDLGIGLNQGYSRQAPPSFVELAIMDGLEELQGQDLLGESDNISFDFGANVIGF